MTLLLLLTSLVLAPAALAAPAAPAAPAASGAGPDVSAHLGKGVQVKAADGTTARARLLFQERLQVVEDGSPLSPTLAVPVLRPDLRLALGGLPVSARVQTELAGPAAALLDATLTVADKDSGLAFTAGRFLLPGSRENLTPVPLLALQNFAPSADAWRRGRDLGLMGTWRPRSGVADVRIAAVDGTPLPDGTLDSAVLGRAAVNLGGTVPLDELAALAPRDAGISLGLTTQVRPRSGDDSVGGDLGAQVGRVQLVVEGHADLEGGGYGAYGQLGVGVVEEKLLAVARVDRLAPGGGPDATSGEAGLVWAAEGAALRLGLAHRVTRPDQGGRSQTTGVNAQLWF